MELHDGNKILSIDIRPSTLNDLLKEWILSEDLKSNGTSENLLGK